MTRFFTKKDLLFSIITGLTTGIVTWRIFSFLGVPQLGNISFAWLVLAVPLLWILGINLGYFLGRWFSFFNQFGKFSAIGFTNAAVDLGILNLLISFSGIAFGLWFTVFKGLSFVAAATHSYVWNKYWTFEAGESGGGAVEFTKFLGVVVLASIINIAVASFIVNGINPLFGADLNSWANIGAVVGSAMALIFSFIGFKVAVFRKATSD